MGSPEVGFSSWVFGDCIEGSLLVAMYVTDLMSRFG